ncbi:DUF423 domain-containing protein [Shewanella cyperi]|uniref:DUF423 domain-containing protein n=1 Tax=Shewanella cyperi TaxID=2814292 RepID=UPI001A944E7E|nr:DUF423 domain-containing protein [Shewanella cyperi]QSX42558.1 DUF423 domain-containing protein [Shewanella cyperi]
MNRGLFLLACVSGFLAVAFGAFGSHGLKQLVSAEMLGVFHLAVEYQFYHTFALIAVALARPWVDSPLLNWAARLFIAGMLLFCGSLYALVLTGHKWLGPITPLGGLCLLAGWLLLAAGVWRSRGAQ